MASVQTNDIWSGKGMKKSAFASGVKVGCERLAQKHDQSFLFQKFDIVQQTFQVECKKNTISGDCCFSWSVSGDGFSPGLFALPFFSMNVLRFAYVLSHGNLHIIDVWLKRMESKKKLPYDPQEVPKAKRFRANLSDAFLSGEVSGYLIPCFLMPWMLELQMCLTWLATTNLG